MKGLQRLSRVKPMLNGVTIPVVWISMAVLGLTVMSVQTVQMSVPLGLDISVSVLKEMLKMVNVKAVHRL
jgi:hypothetical protein